MPPDIDSLLKIACDRDASDLHLTTDEPPILRCNGRIEPLTDAGDLSEDDVRQMFITLTDKKRLEHLMETKEYDGSMATPEGQRVRINAYLQKDRLALALRILPSEFFDLYELGLPEIVCERIVGMHQGLVLVTGATGSGKTTTLASLLNEINRTRSLHIHTIEEPIEYVHTSRQSFVTQRAIGEDTQDFPEASRRALRQDPDVVLIGEMRDTDTMSTALTLAETGHLTLATLHTSTAMQTISRIISAFPAARQVQIRVQLASTLAFVICQKLIPNADGQGRSLAAEILAGNSAVRAMIREKKTHQLKMTMQTNYEIGMRTMNQSLVALVNEGRISRSTALNYSDDEEGLEDLLDNSS